MYKIVFAGYECFKETYATLKDARKVLNECKKEDKQNCRTRFKHAKIKVTSTKNSYKIEFGINLYSAGSIVKI